MEPKVKPTQLQVNLVLVLVAIAERAAQALVDACQMEHHLLAKMLLIPNFQWVS